METKIQKHKIKRKYASYYINLPKHILKKASWLKKQKVVEIDVDLVGHVIIKPE